MFRRAGTLGRFSTDMLSGRLTPDGALYITTIAPQPTDVFWDGVARAPDGATRVVAVAPDLFNNGLGMKEPGAVAVAFGGVISNWQQGLPFTNDGRLVAQLNQPVSPGDGYVGRLRVGALGGVYMVDAAPTSWSYVDLDHDGKLDHVDLQLGTILITDDEDSVNIDINGDGTADIVINK